MRGIKFSPEDVAKIRSHDKVMVLLPCSKPPGTYIVEEADNGHSFQSSLTIKVKNVAPVKNLFDYAEDYHKDEGFESTRAFLDHLEKLYKDDPQMMQELYDGRGFSHEFKIFNGTR